MKACFGGGWKPSHGQSLMIWFLVKKILVSFPLFLRPWGKYLSVKIWAFNTNFTLLDSLHTQYLPLVNEFMVILPQEYLGKM